MDEKQLQEIEAGLDQDCSGGSVILELIAEVRRLRAGCVPGCPLDPTAHRHVQLSEEKLIEERENALDTLERAQAQAAAMRAALEKIAGLKKKHIEPSDAGDYLNGVVWTANAALSESDAGKEFEVRMRAEERSKTKEQCAKFCEAAGLNETATWIRGLK